MFNLAPYRTTKRWADYVRRMQNRHAPFTGFSHKGRNKFKPVPYARKL